MMNVGNCSMYIVKTDEEAMHLLLEHSGEDFAFDIETTGLEFNKHEVVGLALYFESTNAYYIPRYHTDTDLNGNVYVRYFVSNKAFKIVLNSLLGQQGVNKFAHNGKFDLKFLKRSSLNSVRLADFADTLLAARLLDEARDNGLKSLSETVLGIQHGSYKDLPHYPGYDREEFLGVPLQHAAVYAMKDVQSTFLLWEAFEPDLEKQNLMKVFRNIWTPLDLVLTEMEMQGFALDMKKVEEVYEKYVSSHSALLAYLTRIGTDYVREVYGDPSTAPSFFMAKLTKEQATEVVELEDGTLMFEDVPVFFPTPRSHPRYLLFNPGSPSQMSLLLQSKFPDADDMKYTKADALSTGVDNVETLLFHAKTEEDKEFLHALIDFKKQGKFISSFLEAFRERHDKSNHNAMYTTFNQGGARTGRMSSSSVNLQQIPARDERGKEARSMFIARPGKKLLIADYEQFELHLLAHCSQDPMLMTALVGGQDLHVLTASAYAGTTYQELYDKVQEGDPEAKQLRQIGKTVNFASMYGIGPKKLRTFLLVNNKVDVEYGTALDIIKSYNNTYEGVGEWKKRVIKGVLANGYVETITHRRRRLPAIHSKDPYYRSQAERQAVNTIIQGSCGDIISVAMIYIQDALQKFGGYLLVQVHDELVAEVPEDRVEVCSSLMSTLMTEPFNNQLRLPLKTEVSVGDNWGDK